MAEPEVTGGNGWSMENIENSPEEQDNSNRPDSDISVEEILTEDTEEEKEEVKDVEEVVFHLGDILWCRQLNTCYHPAVIVNDPHYKFCTKIVKVRNQLFLILMLTPILVLRDCSQKEIK